MNPDFSLRPEKLFALAGADPNIAFFEPNPLTWEAIEPATILAFPCSVYEGINENVSEHIRLHFIKRRFSKVLEIKSLPILLRNSAFAKSFSSVDRKWILNGAAGTRLRNKYRNANLRDAPEREAEIEAFFAKARAEAPLSLAVVEDGFDPKSMGFAIECRNTDNFYHFIVETLGQLCVAVDLGVTGKVAIHSPSKKPKGFVKDWVHDLFPELRSQIEFVSKPTSYDAVLSSLNMIHSYSFSSDAVMPSFDKFSGKGGYFKGRSSERISLSVLAMNVCDSSLLALRERGLRLCQPMISDSLPERVWVNRKPGGKRDRTMKGQSALASALKKRGFVEVFLEDLRPLEQIALINNAKVIVAAHGAGLANMIFADPSATVIELGNAHTAHYRWGDFVRLAHVAGCTYTNFFADMLNDRPDTVAGLRSSDLPTVDFTAHARAQLLAYIEEVLSDGKGILDKEQFRILSEQYNFNRHFDKLHTLHFAREDWVMNDPHLSSHLANAYRAAGNHGNALVMMRNAHKLAPKHRRIFEKTLHLVAKVEGEKSARAFLEANKKKFPRREAYIASRFEKTLRRIAAS